MFAASGSSLPLPSSPQIAPVALRAEPLANAAAVATQTPQAVQQGSPIRFNPHITYANDIDRVLVQFRDQAGEVTVQYPSEKAVREYRRQMEASKPDEATADRPAPEARPAARPAAEAPAERRAAPAPGAGTVEISA